jgi:hypothetical protein
MLTLLSLFHYREKSTASPVGALPVDKSEFAPSSARTTPAVLKDMHGRPFSRDRPSLSYLRRDYGAVPHFQRHPQPDLSPAGWF